MKKYLLALAASAFTLLLSAAELQKKGNIYSIFPENEADRGRTYETGETVKFVVRLLAYNGDAAGTPAPWVLSHIAIGSDIWDDVYNPPMLGVAVSGKMVGARIVNVTQSTIGTGGVPFTDLHCEYTVKGGDLALPLALALATTPNESNPVIPGPNTSAAEYFLINSDKWALTTSIPKAEGEPDTAVAGFYFCTQQAATFAANMWKTSIPAIGSATTGRDYDLSKCDFKIKTIDFNSSKYSVAKTTTVTGQVVTSGPALTEPQTFYVWAKNQLAVEMSGEGIENINVGTGDRLVAKVTIHAGKTVSDSFSIKGIDNTKSGEMLILSTTKGYRTNAAGDTIVTYLEVPVECTAEPSPNIQTSFRKDDPFGSKEVELPTPIPANGKVAPTPVYVTLSKEYEQEITLSLNVTGNGENSYDPTDEAHKNIWIGEDDVLRSTFNAASLSTITIPAGVTQKTIYLYALRGTTDTAVEGISISVSSDDPNVQTFYNGGIDRNPATLLLSDEHKPIITEPVAAEGEDAYDCGVVEVTGFDLTLKLEDCWYDTHKGDYTVKISYSNSKSMTLEKVSFATGKATIKVKDFGALEGPRTATIRISETANESSWTETKIKFDVKAAKAVRAEFYDGSTADTLHDGTTFTEGAMPYVRFTISEAVPSGEPRYAFLVPANEATAKLVDPNTLKKGAKIEAGQLVSELKTRVEFLDGDAELAFRVVLATSATLNETAGDDYNVDESYAATEVELTVENVPARITDVIVADESVEAGKTREFPIACGVPVSFAVTAADVTADLDTANADDRLVAIWSYTDDERHQTFKYLIAQADADGFIESSLTFKTPNSMQIVNVMVLDKDTLQANGLSLAALEGYSSAKKKTLLTSLKNKGIAEYSINVPVGTAPVLTLTPVDFIGGDTILESDKTGFIRVKLSDIVNRDVPVTITAKSNVTNKGGNFAFADPNGNPNGVTTIDLVIPAGSSEPEVGGVYTSKGLKINYATLDGTSASASEGWTLTPSTTDTYFTAVAETIYIVNAAPVIRPAEPANLTTNQVSVGEAVIFTWNVKDVAVDNDAGLVAKWYVNDVYQSEKDTTIAADQIGIDQTTELVFSEPGFKDVRVEVTDKDGADAEGVSSRRWYYMVPLTKELQLTPVGPSKNTSSKYRSAKGIGKGRTGANNASGRAQGFSQFYNYSVSTGDAYVYAFGYKPGQVETGEFADSSIKGVRVDAYGNTTKGDAYVYSEGYNNFFYRWGTYEIGTSTSEPEYTVAEPAMTPDETKLKNFSLDKWEKDKLSYNARIVEAIFSRGYRPLDMAGDINADGIPDLVVKDTTLGGSAVGKMPEDDLADLSTVNDDGEELPSAFRSLYGQAYKIPEFNEDWLKGLNAFTAKMEIRGIHDGLNDALVPDSKRPYKFSVDGAVAGAMDYSPAELLAYEAWNAAHPGEPWSPENPTDPTKDDTDDDGLNDALEYYYWYAAHVGGIDNDGNWTRMTGEKYNPLNPTEGELITSETIETLFNPTVPYAYGNNGNKLNRDSIDTDGDGLSDLLEYDLGTNPFHWDTDGDGMPDGWEVLRSNTDPCVADAGANADGDFMAWIEMSRVDMNGELDAYTIIGTVDDLGTTHHYAIPRANYTSATEDLVENVEAENTYAWVFTHKEGKNNVVYAAVCEATDAEAATNEFNNIFVEYSGKHYLAKQLDRTKVFHYDGNARGTGAQFDAGTPVTVNRNNGPRLVVERKLVANLTSAGDFLKRSYTAFRYGKVMHTHGNDSFPVFAITKDIGINDANAAPGVTVVEILAPDTTCVYLMHHQVYQRRGFYFPEGDPALDCVGGGLVINRDMGTGFNPTTAWFRNGNGNVGSRYDNNNHPDSSLIVMEINGGKGSATDTKAFTAADEFLLMNWHNHLGVLGDSQIVPEKANKTIASIWGAYTTKAGNHGAENHGSAADSDGDGIPDGWELYIACGPGNAQGNHYKHQATFNPCNADDANNDVNRDPVSGAITPDMDPRLEFYSTDSVKAYAGCPTIPAVAQGVPVFQQMNMSSWINKYFPTDPWSSDTDGDGITDLGEATFFYGSPADNGDFCVAGGGLNPCSWDTDLDGIPDAWEKQFPGSYITPDIYAKAAETLPWVVARDYVTRVESEKYLDAPPANPGCYFCGGMDGTVQDSYTDGSRAPIFNVNRDWDFDGLDPWQEYLTGMIRQFRYDDILSPFETQPVPAEPMPDEDGMLFTFTKAQLDDMLATSDHPINPLLTSLDLETFATTNIVEKGRYDIVAGAWIPVTNVTTHVASAKLRGGSNPNMVFGRFDAWGTYGSKCRRPWDWATGYWYYFPDGPNHCLKKAANAYVAKLILDLGEPHVGLDALLDFSNPEATSPEALAGLIKVRNSKYDLSSLPIKQFEAPTKYASTDPSKTDTDDDGMDDFYEIFHGLNPLYGGTLGSDIVASAWDLKINAQHNYWTEMNPDADMYDFTKFPWMAGDPAADPDGDDIRNDEEAIQANMQTSVAFHHTDPTPLWMTDESYPGSISATSYAWTSSADQILNDNYIKGVATNTVLNSTVVTNIEETISGPLTNITVNIERIPDPNDPNAIHPTKIAYLPEGALRPLTMPLHLWSSLNHYNFEFEQNEGYDSDHDGLSDFQEASASSAGQTDPLDGDDPHRRQAMYFPGMKNGIGSALQARQDPLFEINLNSQFNFFEFTVESWIRPEVIETEEGQVILERAVKTLNSNPLDERLLRRNFAIGLTAEGHIYAAYDANGTADAEIIAMASTPALKDEWVHVAASYDGRALRLYINGIEVKQTPAQLRPTTPQVTTETTIGYQHYANTASWTNSIQHVIGKSVYQNAIIFGAGAADEDALTLSGTSNWSNYTKFYNGYIDEVRIWDGARTGSDITSNYRKRFSTEELLANRNEIYAAALKGASRAESSDGEQLPAELVYHYNFGGLFAGATDSEVAKTPFGFDPDPSIAQSKASVTRPVDYASPVWTNLVAVRSTVYTADNYIPWIPNAINRLPRFDGTTQDSVFWSDDYAGFTAAINVGEKKYIFPHSHELYPNRKPIVLGLATQSTRVTQLAELNRKMTDLQSFNLSFTDHLASIDGTDLLPLGGAYVKYCPDYWDEMGPTTTWEITGVDNDNDGIADWWELATLGSLEKGPNDIITHNGREMTALDAYRRDLAAGAHNAPGKQTGDTNFAQTADENHNGLPDWWEKLYALNGASATDDTDGDGLSNYTEYLLSEVFSKLNMEFNPRNAYSIDAKNLDYFAKIGKLYVGEIFTDHDLIEDEWEDLYADKPGFVSRLSHDATSDNDGDGWTARSEARYSQMSREIAADKTYHYDVLDTLQRDYPVPTVKVTLNYTGKDANGFVDDAQQQLVANASAVVAVTSDPKLQNAYDAIWKVPGANGETADEKSDSDVYAYTFNIGRWSDRHVVGNLTPGNVKADSIRLQNAFNPSAEIVSWYLSTVSGDRIDYIYRGTREEFEEAQRKYGSRHVHMLQRDTAFETLTSVVRDYDEQTQTVTFRLSTTMEEIAKVNLETGAFDIDLGVFKGKDVVTGGDESTEVSMEDLTYRFAYSTNPSVGLPRKLYLGEATTGHVREGNNHFVAWLETVEENGKYDPGEPFGYLGNVDVGWNSAEVKIDLTQTHPIFARVVIPDGNTDREFWYGTESGNWQTSGGVIPGDRNVRVRVVRTLVNDYPTGIVKDPQTGDMTGRIDLKNEVILDKELDLLQRNYLHEGDFLATGAYDLDWEKFRSDVVLNSSVRANIGDVTSAVYRIVLGNGSIDPNETNNVAAVAIKRSFDSDQGPSAIDPSKYVSYRKVAHPEQLGTIETAARPTLRWKIGKDGDSLAAYKDAYNSYPAFRVRIYTDAACTSANLVYDSGIHSIAEGTVDGDNTFNWAPEISVGDKVPQSGMTTKTNKVFENGKQYYYTAALYNSKFRNDPETFNKGSFFMNVPVNNIACGSADVCVKYFGPEESYSNQVVRVQAFSTPDFSGKPVVTGYVKDLESVSTPNTAHVANCHLTGIPAGTYYFRAFIDVNDDGVCQPAESQGWLCQRGVLGVSAPFSPTGVKYATNELGKPVNIEIYLEDMDTDHDGIPDGYELAMTKTSAAGSNLSAYGTDKINDTVTEIGIALYGDLSNMLSTNKVTNAAAAGMSGTILSTLNRKGVAALALGINLDNLTLATTVEGLSIAGASFDSAKNTITLTIASDASSGVNSTSPAAGIYTITGGATELTVSVQHKATLAEADWTEIGTATLPMGQQLTEVEVALEGTPAASGFFRVVIEE